MPSINQVVEVATKILQKSPQAVPFFRGKPGMGKSDACIQVGYNLDLEDDRILVVHVNNHDVVDFTGVPSVTDGQTQFNPTEMFYKFREGTGAGLVCRVFLWGTLPYICVRLPVRDVVRQLRQVLIYH